MSGSSFGKLFKVTTFGESHCYGVGAIVDGVPPRMDLAEEDIQTQLTRRRPGQSALSTPRNEEDQVCARARTARSFVVLCSSRLHIVSVWIASWHINCR